MILCKCLKIPILRRTLVFHALYKHAVKSNARPFYENYLACIFSINFTIEPAFIDEGKLLISGFFSEDNKMMTSIAPVSGYSVNHGNVKWRKYNGIRVLKKIFE